MKSCKQLKWRVNYSKQYSIISITQVGQQERSEPEGPHREPHCGSVQRAGNQPQAFRPGLQASDIQVRSVAPEPVFGFHG